MRKPAHRTGKLLGAAVAAVTAIGVASPAVASDPSDTTLSDPGKATMVSEQFTGTIMGTGHLYPFIPCTALFCDTHALHMAVPANFWKTHTGNVTVQIAWDDASADLDIEVYDASGNLVAQAANAGEGPEMVDLGALAPGDYSIEVQSWLSLPETAYTGTITMNAKSIVKKKRHRRR